MERKFKIGAVVKRIKGGKHGILNVGSIVTVKNYRDEEFTIDGDTHSFSFENFELVSNKIKLIKLFKS